MSSKLIVKQENDYFSLLPYYILRALLIQLPIKDLQAMIFTCKRFVNIIKNEAICKEICWKWLVTQFPKIQLQFALPEKTTWRWLLRCIMNPIDEQHLTQITQKVIVFYNYKEKNHIYLGELSAGGIKDGAGILFQERENQIFSGHFFRNLRQGKGKEIYPSGDYYDGEWENDLQNGKGVRVFQAGTYSGEWKDNQRDGYGQFKWSSGSEYEGYWEKDQKQGFGSYKWKSGDKYKGYWRTGTYDYGSYSSYFGSQYVGDHNNEGKFEGKGYFIHPDSSFWFGDWKNGLPTDENACLHPNMRKCFTHTTCTKSVTKNSCYYGQVLYKCNCSEDPICKICAHRCHQGHVFEEIFWTVGRTYCHCSCSES